MHLIVILCNLGVEDVEMKGREMQNKEIWVEDEGIWIDGLGW